jgi:hypothetical protein
MRDLAAAANRIDYWIRRHVIVSRYGTHPPSQSKLNSARDRRGVGCQQLGNASKTSTTPWRPPSPRISLHSSSNLKRRNGDRPLGTPPGGLSLQTPHFRLISRAGDAGYDVLKWKVRHARRTARNNHPRDEAA